MSGPVPRVPRWITAPAARLYGAGVRWRNARFDRGDGVASIATPVISVGNITVGGSGKTPTVTWLARHLLESQRRPVIAMRGYGANPARGETSDEEAEYRELLPDVPLVVNPDRTTALRAFLADEHHGVDCVLLDDGFQHRRLGRDLDLVLIDATRTGLDDQLLPAGFLREPATALARADAVIVTRATEVDAQLSEAIERHHGKPPLAWTQHVWTSLDIWEDGTVRDEPMTWLDGREVVTMLGVGNPAPMRAQIESHGARVRTDLPVRDHQVYDDLHLSRAAVAAGEDGVLLVTRKDWVKLRPLLDSPGQLPPIVIPNLALSCFAGEQALRQRVNAAVAS